MQNYTYENSPLVEVIIEVRWELKNAGNSQIDPFFQDFSKSFTSFANEIGFSNFEKLVPDFIPIEVFGYQPILRFRKNKDTWPLYQIGPGIFTANIVPISGKYTGWNTFNEHIQNGLNILAKAYPASEKILKVIELQISYINAINETYDFNGDYNELSAKIDLGSSIPPALLELKKTDGKIQCMFETRIPLENLKDSFSIFKYGPGIHENKPSCLIENKVLQVRPPEVFNIEETMKWLDTAHETTRYVFEKILAEKFSDKFGEKKFI